MAKFVITNEHAQKMFDMNSLAREFRGGFIHYFIDIESIIEVIIVGYFCDTPKKRLQLTHRLVCDDLMPFNAKEKLLAFIIKNEYPEFEKSHPTLLSDIKKLQEFRNIIAHRKILNTQDNFESFNGTDINFENFGTENHKIKTLSEKVNAEIMNNKIGLMENTRTILLEFYDGIINRPSEPTL